ncbi:MAG: hypothetical protein N4A33_13185 [Bacteriovoracaceae bacterium]|jgi:hypothetical protein|nr:hypothetical protein [Bacteriovoracaceae bacterium]
MISFVQKFTNLLCTAAILCFVSCGKKIENTSQANDIIDVQTGLTEYSTTLRTTSGKMAFLEFSYTSEVKIPKYVKTTLGYASGQVARIYFDYIGELNYGYYCDYLPSNKHEHFEFDSCYDSEISPTTLTYYVGYQDVIFEGKSIALEIINDTSLRAIDAKVDFQINKL